MAQSLSKIYIHLIFHIKTTSSAIRQEDIERVHCYVGQLVNTTGCKTVKVGGVNDHVHIQTILVSRRVQTILVIIRRRIRRGVCVEGLRLKAFALTGRGDSTMRKTQGVASLALGYVLHWAFSPPLLNPKR